jgi:alkylation response protein AidB-like acyl-CoA dehydrogenase
MPANNSAGLIQRAGDLAPQVAAARKEIDASRQLPAALADALRNAGMFRLFTPAVYGGYEADPAVFVQVVEELSRADGSVGWVVSVCSVGGLFAGSMPEASACEIHSQNPDFHVAGSLNPNGTAASVEGGYLVTGRWTYASGIRHAPWVYANCLVDGGPAARLMLFPVEQCRVHDTWTTGGLRGTGSHDFSVENLFVPASRTFAAFVDPPSRPGVLYRYPFSFLAVLIAAVPLGIARGSIDALLALAKAKKISGRASVQTAVARAEALVRSGRAFLFSALEDMRAELAGGGEAALETRAALRLACTLSAQNSAQAVDLMYEAAGVSAIFETTPLERQFRDVHAALQHIVLAPDSLERAGRVYLGLDPGPGRF